VKSWQETTTACIASSDSTPLTQPVEVWGGTAELARQYPRRDRRLIASGIAPKKTHCVQPEPGADQAELAWIFNCVGQVGWLNELTKFTEKAGKDARRRRGALRLSGADGRRLLLYAPPRSPGGQRPETAIRIVRDIAQKFNNDFGDSIRATGITTDRSSLPEP